MLSVCFLPLRHTSMAALEPGLVAATSGGSWFELSIGLPLYERMTSPGLSPAFSAGPPDSTVETSAPCGRSRPNDCASEELRSWMPTPMRPRSTLPVFSSCSATLEATSTGIANATPM